MFVLCLFILLWIVEKGGDGMRAVMERDWREASSVLMDFFVLGVVVLVVNLVFKYLINSIMMCFCEWLILYVYDAYLSYRAYYKAAVFRYGDLDNVD